MGYITAGLLAITFGFITFLSEQADGDSRGFWTPVEVAGLLGVAGGALLVLGGMVAHYLTVRNEVIVRRPPFG